MVGFLKPISITQPNNPFFFTFTISKLVNYLFKQIVVWAFKLDFGFD